MAFNLNECIISPSGHLILSWADIMNRADLGMELMHERMAQAKDLQGSLSKLISNQFRGSLRDWAHDALSRY